jgi:hypothetical protein
METAPRVRWLAGNPLREEVREPIRPIYNPVVQPSSLRRSSFILRSFEENEACTRAYGINQVHHLPELVESELEGGRAGISQRKLPLRPAASNELTLHAHVVYW